MVSIGTNRFDVDECLLSSKFSEQLFAVEVLEIGSLAGTELIIPSENLA